jgi:hypothetical protein
VADFASALINLKISEKQMNSKNKAVTTGYDYTKQIEGEQAPLRPSQVAIVRAQIISSTLAGLIALAWWRFGEGQSVLADRAGVLAVGSVLLVPIIVCYMRKMNGIQAASNRPLSGVTGEASEAPESEHFIVEGSAGDIFWSSTLSILPGGRFLYILGKIMMMKLGVTKVDESGMRF